jgi:NitT/TauT family transport system substrate-binding protein
VRIGFSKGYGPAVTAYVAKEAGLFAQNGIEAELQTFNGGGGVGEALAAGAIDIGQVPVAVLAPAIKRGLEARVVSQSAERPYGYYLMVLPNSPYKVIKDLDGKKVGITSPGSTTDAYTRYFARQHGIKLTPVAVGVAGLQALDRKQIDAVIAFPPFSEQARLAGTAVVIADLAKDIPAHVTDVWDASGSMIKDRPDLVRRALTALYGATTKLKNDRTYAIRVLKEFMGSQVSDAVATAVYEGAIVQLSTDGVINPAAMEMSLKLLVDAGADPASLPKASDIYVSTFVPVSQ